MTLFHTDFSRGGFVTAITMRRYVAFHHWLGISPFAWGTRSYGAHMPNDLAVGGFSSTNRSTV
jgi:hypothetical protein